MKFVEMIIIEGIAPIEKKSKQCRTYYRNTNWIKNITITSNNIAF